MIKKGDISIIGAGSWGTSVAKVIAEKHTDVTVKMWAYEKEVVHSINNFNVNNEFLPGVGLPANIAAFSDIRDAVEDCIAVIFATPSKVLYDTSLKAKKHLGDNVIIGYLTKGFCKIHNEILPISDMLSRVFPKNKNSIVAIYGPSHAEEVSRGYHTCLNIAGHSREARRFFNELLSTDYIGCREISDIRGVDLGATLKNPAAIAAGILSMLPSCGDNLAGALIVEALEEMMKLGRALDIKEDTLLGIAGLGDLVGTALSDHSRNRRFGKDIASQIMKTGKSLNLYDRIIIRFNPDHVLEKMSERFNYLAEGAYAIEPIIELAESHNISIPVYKALYEILLNKKDTSLLIETVKKPDMFEELFEQTKILTTEKKVGLEKATGSVFKKAIIRDTMEKFLNDPELLNMLFETKRMILEGGNRKDRSNRLMMKHAVKEYELFKKLDPKNPKKGLKNLCKFYIDDISDSFNFFAYKFIVKCVKFLNIFRLIFGSRYNRKLFENNVKVRGNISEIKKIDDTSNIVYVSTYRSCFDFAYINMAIDRFGLHVPRFCFEKKSVNKKLKEYIIRLMGGYIIDFGRTGNPIYQEISRNYLSTLIGHGVHIVFFPEITVSRDGTIGKINHDFLSVIMESLFKNTEEIALVPMEISYYKRPNQKYSQDDALNLKKILSNRVDVNFSSPILASDFSKGEKGIPELAATIEESWKLDSHIFPHYIFCRIVKNNNYQLSIDRAGIQINEFLMMNDTRINYKPRVILKEGANFVLKGKIGEIKNGRIVINRTDDIDYYSNLSN